MDPLTLSLLGAGTLGSLFGGGKQQKPLDVAELTRLFGPDAVAQIQKALFNLQAGSEAFRGNVGRTNVAAQQFGQGVARNLARTGLGDTAIGAISGAAGGSAGGFALSDLIGNLFNSSLGGALDINKTLAGLFQGERQIGANAGPTPLQRVSGSLLGAVGPLLLNQGTTSALTKPAGAANSGFSMKNWLDSINMLNPNIGGGAPLAIGDLPNFGG